MRKFVLFAYAASVVLVALMGWALYRVTGDAMQASARVDHTMQALQQIAGVNGSLARAESAQRGYLLYSQQDLLRERDAELRRAHGHANGVLSLTVEDAAQQQRARELAQLLDRRAALMNATAAAPGQELTAHIYALTDTMAVEERRLLDERKAAEARDYRMTRYVLLASAIVLLGVILPGWALSAREAARRMRAERTMLQLAESLPGAVFQFRTFADGRSRFELLSASIEKIRGVDREQVMHDPEVLMQTVVEADRKIVRGALAQNASTLTPFQIDYRCMVKGERRWIRTVAAPRRERDGSIVWSGHWDDVTTQRELETELLRSMAAADAANRAKSAFLATMSHEIRTPMNGVLGMLELLSLTRLDAEQRTALGVVRDSGKALLRIIDDILDLSKIEAGRLDLVPEVVSVRDVVDRVWSIYAGAASSKGLLLKRFFDSRISPAVLADPVRLQQVLGNLVSNALKFTEAGGASISAELVERAGGRDVVQFAVSDSGIGVSVEQQARLFEPFTQADGTVSSQYGGTGLGLAISRRLASLMGGELRMESERGRGTRMLFTVPLPVADGAKVATRMRKAPAAAPTRPPPSVAQAERERRLVLVVDDHPLNRTVMLRQVNAIGYAAQTAEDGVDALEKWSSGRFAAVITDCNMPRMSGYELSRRIREGEKQREGARTAIIACTANALGGEAEKCIAAGMDDYIAKPVTLEQLAEKMARWLPITARASDRFDAPRPIDAHALDETAGGDAALGRELLAKFHQYNVEDARALREAARKRDMPRVVLYSHRIKGASRTIGATELASVCERIECSARAADPDAVTAHLTDFDAEVGRVDEYILDRRRSA
ncbi:MAG: ATP-binding protein [Betaproteobacteria bacterium]